MKPFRLFPGKTIFFILSTENSIHDITYHNMPEKNWLVKTFRINK